MPPQLHPEANAILARLRKEGITNLYHFTSVENLPSICQSQMLCSKQLLEDEDRWPPLVTGGNATSLYLDRRNGNWDKISLSLTPFTPMSFYRKKEGHLCYFVVRPDVAAWQNVVFTDTNATKKGHRRNNGLTGLNLIKFEAIRSIPRPFDGKWRTSVQAEVLVPNSIPLSYVTNISFVSNASMAYAKQLCGSRSHPQFTVNEQIFADVTKASNIAVDFSHVIDLRVTGTNIIRNMLSFPYSFRNKYSKRIHPNLALMANVYTTAGTQAKIYLRPSGTQRTVDHLVMSDELATLKRNVRRYTIPVNALSTGPYVIEYHLNGRCWASVDFELIQ